MSMVGWDKVCMPKNHGGLGFKKIDEMNQALLMKLSWEVVSNSDKLWVKVLCSKYGLEPQNLPRSLPAKPGSRIWQAIRNMWVDTMHGARWSICDGASTRFWLDCWVTKYNPLFSLAIQPISQDIINASVCEFTNENGGWNWSKFEHLLLHYTLMQIASIMPPALHLGADKIFWGFDPRGMFTVQSAYDSLCHHHFAAHDRNWKIPWSWKGPQSIRLFLWQVVHGKLKTHDELARRHIHVPLECDRCGGAVEDILHALRDCSCINQVWRKLVPKANHNSFFSSNSSGLDCW